MRQRLKVGVNQHLVPDLVEALPGLSGATLRIFYSFMVPIFGGRKWTAISTASLLLPAIGIGFAVQSTPHIPQLWMSSEYAPRTSRKPLPLSLLTFPPAL